MLVSSLHVQVPSECLDLSLLALATGAAGWDDKDADFCLVETYAAFNLQEEVSVREFEER